MHIRLAFIARVALLANRRPDILAGRAFVLVLFQYVNVLQRRALWLAALLPGKADLWNADRLALYSVAVLLFLYHLHRELADVITRRAANLVSSVTESVAGHEPRGLKEQQRKC